MSNLRRLRRLSIDEIEKLAERGGVRKIAVENFLMTVANNNNDHLARQNLLLDAGLYNWDKNTIEAIIDGIDMACERTVDTKEQ